MASKFVFRKMDGGGYSVALRESGIRIGYLYPAYSGRGWDVVTPQADTLWRPSSSRDLGAERLLSHHNQNGGVR